MREEIALSKRFWASWAAMVVVGELVELVVEG